MGGLVHYYNPILESLNRLEGYELATLTPEHSSGSLGKGVHQETKNLRFKTFFLPEKKGLFGKSFFKGFNTLLGVYKPDIVISGWPYSMEIILNPFIKTRGIKLVHKDIPFNLPPYNEAMKAYRSGTVIVSEDYKKSKASDWKGLLNYWLVTRLRKAYLTRADAHVCYTEAAFELFPGYGVKKENIFIIYNSPDTVSLMAAASKAKYLPDLLPPNLYRIIHVGRLVKWKKVDLILHAMARLKETIPGLELVVVGDGPERKSMEALVNELDLADQVRFVGAVYDPIILAKYHQESTLYVLGGIGGLSINEAMCFGKPILCSVADGTEKMLVREEENGLYFKTDDEEDLASKILTLLSQPEKCSRFGERSLQIIREEINEFRVIEGYEKAFSFLFPKDH